MVNDSSGPARSADDERTKAISAATRPSLPATESMTENPSVHRDLQEGAGSRQVEAGEQERTAGLDRKRQPAEGEDSPGQLGHYASADQNHLQSSMHGGFPSDAGRAEVRRITDGQPAVPPGEAATPLLPPTILPAVCQLLLVYIQRALLMSTLQPSHTVAAAPTPARPPVVPLDQQQQPQPLQPQAGPQAEARQQQPAGASGQDGGTDPPPLVAVRQLRAFDIPVPLLLQAAAHLMVVGALIPPYYKAIQAELAPETMRLLPGPAEPPPSAVAVGPEAVAVAPGSLEAAMTTTTTTTAVVGDGLDVAQPRAAPGVVASGPDGPAQSGIAAAAVAAACNGLATAAKGGGVATAAAATAPPQPGLGADGALEAGMPGVRPQSVSGAVAGTSGGAAAPTEAPDGACPDPATAWRGRGGGPSPQRLGLGRRLFSAIADQLPKNTELDSLLPPLFGYVGVLYRVAGSAEIGGALWDGALLRILGSYTTPSDARKSVRISIKLFVASAAVASPPTSSYHQPQRAKAPRRPDPRAGIIAAAPAPAALADGREAPLLQGEEDGAARVEDLGGGVAAPPFAATERASNGAAEAAAAAGGVEGHGGGARVRDGGVRMEADVAEAAEQLLLLRNEAPAPIQPHATPLVGSGSGMGPCHDEPGAVPGPPAQQRQLEEMPTAALATAAAAGIIAGSRGAACAQDKPGPSQQQQVEAAPPPQRPLQQQSVPAVAATAVTAAALQGGSSPHQPPQPHGGDALGSPGSGGAPTAADAGRLGGQAAPSKATSESSPAVQPAQAAHMAASPQVPQPAPEAAGDRSGGPVLQLQPRVGELEAGSDGGRQGGAAPNVRPATAQAAAGAGRATERPDTQARARPPSGGERGVSAVAAAPATAGGGAAATFPVPTTTTAMTAAAGGGRKRPAPEGSFGLPTTPRDPALAAAAATSPGPASGSAQAEALAQEERETQLLLELLLRNQSLQLDRESLKMLISSTDGLTALLALLQQRRPGKDRPHAGAGALAAALAMAGVAAGAAPAGRQESGSPVPGGPGAEVLADEVDVDGWAAGPSQAASAAGSRGYGQWGGGAMLLPERSAARAAPSRRAVNSFGQLPRPQQHQQRPQPPQQLVLLQLLGDAQTAGGAGSGGGGAHEELLPTQRALLLDGSAGRRGRTEGVGPPGADEDGLGAHPASSSPLTRGGGGGGGPWARGARQPSYEEEADAPYGPVLVLEPPPPDEVSQRRDGTRGRGAGARPQLTWHSALRSGGQEAGAAAAAAGGRVARAEDRDLDLEVSQECALGGGGGLDLAGGVMLAPQRGGNRAGGQNTLSAAALSGISFLQQQQHRIRGAGAGASSGAMLNPAAAASQLSSRGTLVLSAHDDGGGGGGEAQAAITGSHRFTAITAARAAAAGSRDGAAGRDVRRIAPALRFQHQSSPGHGAGDGGGSTAAAADGASRLSFRPTVLDAPRVPPGVLPSPAPSAGYGSAGGGGGGREAKRAVRPGFSYYLHSDALHAAQQQSSRPLPSYGASFAGFGGPVDERGQQDFDVAPEASVEECDAGSGGGAGLRLGGDGGASYSNDSAAGAAGAALGPRAGGELGADAAEPLAKRRRQGQGQVSKEYAAVTNLMSLGLQEALAIVRQRIHL